MEPADLNNQVNALQAAGCSQVVVDDDGTRTKLDQLLDSLDPGDSLVIWRLDKFVDSVQQLAERLEQIKQKRVMFRSLQEKIKPTDPEEAHRLENLVTAMAELEAQLRD